MLWLVTGGVCSGKSAFAKELAHTVGREGIRLSCPSFPEWNADGRQDVMDDRIDFTWNHSEADKSLAYKLNAINLESNIFRADRRVLVVDSLSGWLRGLIHREALDDGGWEDHVGNAWEEVLQAILSFQGKMIVVTEDVTAGYTMNRKEREYTYRLATANRQFMEASTSLYRMTAGIASELKGYRLQRGNIKDENIYSDR